MENGDFVLIDLIARIKDTNEIFDLTLEEVAKKENIYNENVKYEPIGTIIGANYLIKGLEKGLKEMKVGEKRKIIIKPEEGFGERKEDLIKTIPISSIEKGEKLKPGTLIDYKGIRGKVISNDGGRIKIDFNHPLAGKTLEYEVEIKKKVEDLEEKVKIIVKYFTSLPFGEIDVKKINKEVEISFPKDVFIDKNIKQRIFEEIKKWVKLEIVKFVEVYK